MSEMKSLVKKKPRVKWYVIVSNSSYLVPLFRKWRKSKSRNIKSMDRLAYCFLRHYLGIDFIRYVRDCVRTGKYVIDAGDLWRIAHTPWIVSEEDD